MLAVGCLTVLAVAYSPLYNSDGRDAERVNVQWGSSGDDCEYTDCWGEYDSCMEDCDSDYPDEGAGYSSCAKTCDDDLYNCEEDQLWCPYNGWW